MRNPGSSPDGQTFHVAFDQSETLKTALGTGLEQQLESKTNAEQGPVGLIPAFQIWNQTRGLKIVDGWVEGPDARQNQSIATIEVAGADDTTGLMTKAVEGLLHRVEIAHAVINQTEMKPQSTVLPLLMRGSEILRDRAGQGCLGNSTHNGVDLLAALEHHQRWDAADAVLTGDVGVFVGIQLEDLDLTIEFLGDFFDDGSHHAAGATPGCPEVDQNRDVALQDVLLERGVSNRSGAGHMVEMM